MSSNLIEILKQRTSLIVSEGFILYEKKYGRFSTSKLRNTLEAIASQLLIEIIQKLEKNEPISIDSFKQIIIEGLLEIGLGEKYPVEVFDEIFSVINNYTEQLPGSYPELLSKIEKYKELIVNSITSRNFFSSSIFDILQAPEEYQYSENQFIYPIKEIEESSRRIYTLFKKERYWEVFKDLSNTTSYSPLSYNRLAAKIGKEKYRLPITYRDLVIYEDELYKLNSGVTSPTRQVFESSQWTKFVSKRLNPLAKFKTAFENNIQLYYIGFLENGFDINSIISDSKIEEYSHSPSLNEELLTVTFGGEGKSILNNIKRLKTISDYFGSYEGSVIGGIQYISEYSQYLFGATYGRANTDTFVSINGESSFGKFDILFGGTTSPNKIPGLKFLSGFLRLKSFVHNQQVPDGVSIDSPVITYNSVYAKFKFGLLDRYQAKIKANTYTIPPKVDLLFSGINTIYNRCLYLGDLTQSMLNSLDATGKLPGSEGLGSIEPQLSELQRIFPPSPYMESLGAGAKPGLSGVVKFLKESYSDLYNTFIYTQLPGDSLEFLLKAISTINDQIKNIYDSITKLSISSFEYIPNISNISFQGKTTSLISFMRSLGFLESEINKVTSIKTFSELVTSFAPISDSNDLKSFFKGFELSQLIYEIGGEEAINAYLSFLYSTSEIDSLLNILSLAQKDVSKATYIQIDKYPRLIGLLIGLTFAVDPTQLIKFTQILGQNNLTLLESITYLFESGQENIIKSKDQVNILSGVLDQIIQGSYQDEFLSPDLNYQQINKISPIALKEWTKIIGNNLGNIPSKKLIEGLYDNAIGLTPKELVTILGETSPVTPLGQILDGFDGGNFTKFIQYSNLTGLGIKLGYYKNSQQLNNFELRKDIFQNNILTLLDAFDSVSKSIEIVGVILESNLDYTFSSKTNNVFDALINSQNKSFDSLNEVITSILSVTDEDSSLSLLAGNSPIVESPGIGNSRLPNRIPVINSITPEQYRVLFSSQEGASAMLNLSNETQKNVISKFFKISEDNKLINLIDNTNETESLPEQRTDTSSWLPATEYEKEPEIIQIPSIEYSIPPIYQEEGEVSQINSSVLGVSYIPENTLDFQIPKEIFSTFNPISSCQRFGGQNCDNLYLEVSDRCVGPINKSLFPEEYKSIPGSSSNSISIDRPLGSFNEFKSEKTFFPTSLFKSPPSYVKLLGNDIQSFSRKGEPILKNIKSSPITFSSGGGEISEFNNTEFGIVEAIKNKLEKNSEFSCASFKSPFEYQICMNIVKCKKFSIPYAGKYFLEFCPKTLAGGRLK